MGDEVLFSLLKKVPKAVAVSIKSMVNSDVPVTDAAIEVRVVFFTSVVASGHLNAVDSGIDEAALTAECACRSSFCAAPKWSLSR